MMSPSIGCNCSVNCFCMPGSLPSESYVLPGIINSLLYKNNKFIMPGKTYDSLGREPGIQKLLTEQLQPIEGDIIIVASAIEDEKIAEFSAKSAALWTI